MNANEIERKWNNPPEAVRWVLWLPLAVTITAVASLATKLVIVTYGGFSNSWTEELIPASAASTALLPIIYILVPRFKKTITSTVFAAILIFCLLALAKIGILAYSSEEHISKADWIDGGRALIWLTLGVGTFRECWRGRFN